MIVKNIYIATKKIAVLLNFIFINKSWNNVSRVLQKYEAAPLFSTLIKIRNVSWEADNGLILFFNLILYNKTDQIVKT